MKSLSWGMRDVIPEDAPAAWGARAIMNGGRVSFVPDRIDASFADKRVKDDFSAWLNGPAIGWLRDRAAGIRGNEDAVHAFDDGRFHLRCNAQASHGYLYIAAWMDPA